jgi:membrane protease YdiL (CAAX protease family)
MNLYQTNETGCCEICDKEVKSYHRFCYNCGGYLGSDGMRQSLYKNRGLQSAFSFFFIYLFVCLFVHFTDFFDDYNRLFLAELFLAIITLLYTVANFRSIKPLLRFRNFTFVRLTGCVLLAAIASVIINIIVSKLNISFFGTDAGYYSRYSVYSMPALVMIYSIAINPAIFEELAFRGVIYNCLEKFLDERLVVIVTGFMFAIVHLSLISLFWLVPFGILVGAMRKRFGTIWYGIIFHFIFNLIAVLFDLHKNGYFHEF